ncbi:hypothetical protein FACS1894122_02260 [Alphaproteobacteria bacterium]|nr:hypothetical protein FACS1894122_02260 [Alphaproteobacteria bacterium]
MFNFKISVPFLAFLRNQIPFMEKAIGNQCAEAILFNREDLFGENWTTSWKNIKEAVSHFSPPNVSFHFPVNNSNYCEEKEIFEKLVEAYTRACDLGLAGVVVHSNNIRAIDAWSKSDEVALSDGRKSVSDALFRVKNSVTDSKNTWLSLENMIIMDNYGKEIDPLFIYPEDFMELDESIGTVVDICHFFYTASVTVLAAQAFTNLDSASTLQLQSAYHATIEAENGSTVTLVPNLRPCDYDDIKKFRSVRHWHFSAFRGIAIPFTDQYCTEGVLPEEGDVPEDLYYAALSYISKSSSDHHVVLEIQEDDYDKRNKARYLIKKMQELTL